MKDYIRAPFGYKKKRLRHHLLVSGLEFVHLILRSHCHPNFSRPRRPDGSNEHLCFAMALAKVNAGRPTSIMKKSVWLGMNLTFFLSRNSKVFSRIPLLIARRASSGVRHLAHRELVAERQRSARSQQLATRPTWRRVKPRKKESAGMGKWTFDLLASSGGADERHSQVAKPSK
jgi:hypothetical protein